MIDGLGQQIKVIRSGYGDSNRSGVKQFHSFQKFRSIDSRHIEI